MQPKPSDHLLDIGCGIAGPARWIVAKYGCRVTGVDLTAEFCVAARELNAATGLADRVNISILHGSALSLPVPEESLYSITAYGMAVYGASRPLALVWRSLFSERTAAAQR
jgi:cyclopropane fatty-acyl-phospholipid synthase-like methyltransferase